MDEAKDYKAYLKALKEATKKKQTSYNLGSTKDYLKRRKILAGIKTTKFSCGGMGIAVKGGKFEGVK